jgi:hypothetical protein
MKLLTDEKIIFSDLMRDEGKRCIVSIVHIVSQYSVGIFSARFFFARDVQSGCFNQSPEKEP